MKYEKNFFIGVSIGYMPCLEQDIFGSVNRSLRFHPHTSAGKVLAPFFSDGPCIGFFSTLHYITSHHITLKHIHKITLHYITLHNITLYHITLQNFQNSFLLNAPSHYISVLNSDRPCISFFFHHLITLISNGPVLVSFEFLNVLLQFIPLHSNTMDPLFKNTPNTIHYIHCSFQIGRYRFLRKPTDNPDQRFISS